MKAFLNTGFPKNRGKLNMNTSEIGAVARSFSSISVLIPTLLFSSKNSRNVEKSLLSFNLEVPSSCSEESTVITKSF